MMLSLTSSPHFPSHADIIRFIETFLPPRASVNDVPFLYHTPRHPKYSPSTASVSRIILSITPTTGVYSALNQRGIKYPPACFLHRPWTLNRRNVRRGSVVIASHVTFDAYLTVGWNIALADRLGLRTSDAICIQGYKGDAERKIGLVAPISSSLGKLVQTAKREFGGTGGLYIPTASHLHELSEIKVVAIMNAFHSDEITRVLEAASSTGWTGSGHEILYLTGAAKDYGLKAAAELDMPAFCVGHRACEEWGIRYLEEQIGSRWPELEVVGIFEDEEIPTTKQSCSSSVTDETGKTA